MIEHLTNFPDNVLAFVCKGRVTKADYDTVLVPAVIQTLKTRNKVRLYYETSGDFTGIDPGAMWEDFKVGMEHLSRWERIAVVTDVESDQADNAVLQLLDAGSDEIIFDDGSGASARVDRRLNANALCRYASYENMNFGAKIDLSLLAGRRTTFFLAFFDFLVGFFATLDFLVFFAIWGAP